MYIIRALRSRGTFYVRIMAYFQENKHDGCCKEDSIELAVVVLNLIFVIS